MASSEVYDVEEILGRRFKNGREEYQIKWIGYEETTWEPRSNLNCPEKLRAFLDQLNPRASETRKKLEAIGDGEVESDSIISSETQSSSPSDDEIEYLSKPQPSDNARNEFLHKLKKRVKPLDHKKPLESSQHISRNPLSSSSNLKKIPQKLGGKIQKKVKQQKNPRKTNLRKEKGKGSSDDVEKSPDEARGSITNQYYKENPDKKIQNGNKSNIQSTKMNKFYLEPDAKVYSNVRNPLQVNEPQPGPSKPSEISQKNSKANLQFNQSKRAQKTSNFNSDNKDNGGASDEDFIPHEKSIKIREGDMQKTKPANQEWNPSSNEETLKKKIWGMQVAKKTTRNETIFPMEWERSLPETTLYRKWEGNLYKGKKQNFVSRVEIHPLTEKSDEGLYMRGV